MRVLVLHSDVAPDAPPDEQDTLLTAQAVATALGERGHHTVRRAFMPTPVALDLALAEVRPDIVFNLVETVFGQGDLAGLAAAMLEKRQVRYTGSSSAAIACAANKPLTKQIFRASGLPTPDWSEPPDWPGLAGNRKYVVKSASEDASLGLDDDAVVVGPDAAHARAALCTLRHGGQWFAEAYCPGREFNVSLLEEDGEPRVLPIAEIRFDDWESDRPRLVGYAAKWIDNSSDCVRTPRVFGIEKEAASLDRDLARIAMAAWRLFALKGYARADFRLDADGSPMILELNPNPCLEPSAGFAAAALEAGISYAELVDRILRAAR